MLGSARNSKEGQRTNLDCWSLHWPPHGKPFDLCPNEALVWIVAERVHHCVQDTLDGRVVVRLDGLQPPCTFEWLPNTTNERVWRAAIPETSCLTNVAMRMWNDENFKQIAFRLIGMSPCQPRQTHAQDQHTHWPRWTEKRHINFLYGRLPRYT